MFDYLFDHCSVTAWHECVCWSLGSVTTRTVGTQLPATLPHYTRQHAARRLTRPLRPLTSLTSLTLKAFLSSLTSLATPSLLPSQASILQVHHGPHLNGLTGVTGLIDLAGSNNLTWPHRSISLDNIFIYILYMLHFNIFENLWWSRRLYTRSYSHI